MEKEIFTAIGLVFTFIGYLAYIYSIFRGNTRPHPFSWFIWGLLTAIGFFAQLSDNAGPGAWITGISAAFTFFIAIIGYIKRSEITITRTDTITFVAALTSIPLWLVTDTPLYSVILITIIDAIAFYPTFAKTWHRPDQELPFQTIMAALKFILSLFALNNYTIITVLYPLSLVIMNTAFLIVLYGRRWALKNAR
ncbi:MAG: hypothetical protein HRT94_01330 [Alphaproteobacteria bacterium]|nr:hypothetical protein [Alphaproteobacteria bacterium]